MVAMKKQKQRHADSRQAAGKSQEENALVVTEAKAHLAYVNASETVLHTPWRMHLRAGSRFISTLIFGGSK
jgi:hypothetical protein